jgi:hypothetical protein
MKTNDVSEAAIEYFAEHSHNAWLKSFRKSHPAAKKRPRMCLRGGAMVDINKPWKDLDPKAQAENKRAARDAYRAVTKFPTDREAAAAFVHECWMRRNRKDPSQPKALFAPYAKLSKVEKDKDRQHIDVMKQALAAVRKQAPKRVAKGGGLSPATLRKLEAVAADLSALSGRRVTADQVALAGVQAINAIYKNGLD